MKNFDSLSEREILALAISLEEEDERVYADIAEGLRQDFPATAAIFEGMQQEESGHRRRLLDLYRGKFGDHIPLIRRQDVRGFVQRRPIWLVQPLRLQQVRNHAAAMEAETRRFYEKVASRSQDPNIRQLLNDLAQEERSHQTRAQQLTDQQLQPGVEMKEDQAQRRLFVLQIVQPGLAGLMDGSVSTLAPVFAAALATHNTHAAFLVGLAASVGAGISMGFAEALSDDGSLTGRGHPWMRGLVCGAMTALGGVGHTLPFLLQGFNVALTVAVVIVLGELGIITWVRHRYMDTPLFSSAPGSIDGTQKFIKKTCEKWNLKCIIKETTWINFRDSRNELLEFARQHCRFLLLLDANEELVGGEPLRQFLLANKEDHLFSVNYNILNELYPGSISIFDRFSIIRNDVNVYYKYKTHEILYTPDNGIYTNNKSLTSVPMFIRNDRQKDKPSTNRYKTDLKLLLEELEEGGDKPELRTYYYLGQTYNCLGDVTNARYYYMKCYHAIIAENMYASYLVTCLTCVFKASIIIEKDKLIDKNTYDYEIFWDGYNIDIDKYLEMYSRTFVLKNNQVILIEPYMQVVRYLMYIKKDLDNIEKYLLYLVSLAEPHKYLCEVFAQQLYTERWGLIVECLKRKNKTDTGMYAYAVLKYKEIEAEKLKAKNSAQR